MIQVAERLITRETWHGRMTFDPGYFLGQSLEVYGEWARHEIMLVAPYVRGKIVIDAGAHIGTHSLGYAKLGAKQVFAFEPHPASYRLLEQNCQQQPICCVRAGLGDRSGTIRDLDQECRDTQFLNLEIGGNVRLQLMGDNTSPIGDIRLCRLDDLQLPPVGFIKIDVDGFEERVLEGGRALIARDRPVLYVENDKGHENELQEFVMSFGYVCHWHITPLFNPQNFNGVERDLFPNIHHWNMLCLPREQAS